MGITAAEAAEILAMTPQSVYRLVHQGRLVMAAKYKNAGPYRDDAEQLALEPLKPRQPHPYCATVREVARHPGEQHDPGPEARGTWPDPGGAA